MRFKRHLRLEHGLKGIDIVPLANLLFLLLLFLMLGPSLFTLSGSTVELPRMLTSEAVRYRNLEISLSSENAVYLNGHPVSGSGLQEFLAQVPGKNTSILIKADKKIPLGKVVEIWDLCRRQGISRINIATDR
jgi:biopolymer transport protein ExbD